LKDIEKWGWEVKGKREQWEGLNRLKYTHSRDTLKNPLEH
jgi:hypothetical protein